jgi:hypothetical protein
VEMNNSIVREAIEQAESFIKVLVFETERFK